MGMGGIATSGMQAAMSEMNIISNNIANVNSYGYRKSVGNFVDMFPSSNSSGVAIGTGVDLSSVTQDFSAGRTVQTGKQDNMSIGGSGFFMLKDASTSQVTYSRNGNFTFNPTTGYFMMGNQRLQGFTAVNGAIPPGASSSDLLISTAAIPAKATTSITQSGVNLCSNDAVPVTSPFNPATSTSYNFVSTTPIYDSLGNNNPMSLYYVKTSTANTWNVYAVVNNTVLNSATPGVLTFNTNGTMASQSNMNALQYSPTTGATSPQTVSVDMTGATQFGSPDSTGQFTPSGYPAGSFDSISIDNNGVVSVNYKGNGMKVVAGQVAVAKFSNPQGLSYVGNSSWTATTASGTPNVSTANSSSNITSGQLEISNVDMAQELVGLIDAQNTFQANAQVEQVYSQIMQTVTKL